MLRFQQPQYTRGGTLHFGPNRALSFVELNIKQCTAVKRQNLCVVVSNRLLMFEIIMVCILQILVFGGEYKNKALQSPNYKA